MTLTDIAPIARNLVIVAAIINIFFLSVALFAFRETKTKTWTLLKLLLTGLLLESVVILYGNSFRLPPIARYELNSLSFIIKSGCLLVFLLYQLALTNGSH